MIGNEVIFEQETNPGNRGNAHQMRKELHFPLHEFLVRRMFSHWIPIGSPDNLRASKILIVDHHFLIEMVVLWYRHV